MADTKTTLRELSVIYGVVKLFKATKSEDYSDFIEVITPYSNGSISISVLQKSNISEHSGIIKNGEKIAAAIVKVFNIKELPKMRWVGESTHSGTPVDIFVGDIPISLKEESYILENMGLYRLVNILTNTTHARGDLHIFKKFAPEKYKEWFKETWQILVEQLRETSKITVSVEKKDYVSEIHLQNNDEIILKYQDSQKTQSVTLGSKAELSDFEEKTNSLIREKVFAKWINLYASSNPKYLEIKQECANVAGKNLTELVSQSNGVINLARFLRILDEKYYYAKVSNGVVQIYEVPSIKEFLRTFDIKSLDYLVPKSQLNFYTRLVNNETGKDFTLRNEIRFSHGQFNGTPEAKLYIERGSLLDVIYEKIY